MLIIKGQQVLLDSDIAQLYQVSLSQLHRKIRENRKRFPKDFMFVMPAKELRKIVSIPPNRKKVYVFTLGGIMMSSGIFRSQRANEMSVQLIDHFMKFIKEGEVFKMVQNLGKG